MMDRTGVRSAVNLTGGFGKGLEQAIAAFDQRVPGPLLHLHGADVGRVGGPALPAAAGRRDREGGPGGGEGPQGPEDPRPLPPRARPRGAARQGGRPAVRPDVGGVRRAPPARLHPRLGPRGLLPPHRLHERAVGRARTPPRLVLPREGLPEPPGAHGGARPGLRAPPEDPLRGPARGPRRREPARSCPSRSTASRTSPSSSAPASASSAASRAPRGSSSRPTRTGSSSAPTPCRRRRARATPQQVFKDELYEIYYRFLETEDEYFDYAPAPVPPQGRWRIYGIGLPDGILKKVYHENAERLLGLRA